MRTSFGLGFHFKFTFVSTSLHIENEILCSIAYFNEIALLSCCHNVFCLSMYAGIKKKCNLSLNMKK